MDENEFRAEIAEIFREQDRRLEETSAEIKKLKTALDKTAEITASNAKAINENIKAINENTKNVNKNAKAIDKLSSLWGDFVDVYRFREHQTEKTLSNLSVKISEIDNRTR